MHFLGCEYVASECVNQGRHQCTASTHPACHHRSIQLDALSGINYCLTVERNVVSKLGHDDTGQQARCGQSTLDRPTRRRCLHDAVTMGAGLLAPDGPDDFKRGIDDIQLLGDIFAQRLEMPAARRTGGFERLENVILSWQILRQWSARCRATRSITHNGYGVRHALFSHEIFEPRFKLLDLTVELLGFTPKLHAPELGDLQFELLNFQCTNTQALRERRDLASQLYLDTLPDHQFRFARR